MLQGCRYNDDGVVMSCGATLSWEDGTIGNFNVAFDTTFRMNLEICGAERHLVCSDWMLPFSGADAPGDAPYEIRQGPEFTTKVVRNPPGDM